MREYNKLVRDKVIEHILAQGQPVHWHVANTQEYRRKLWEKLQEEVDEYMESGDELELVDILDVVYALAVQHGHTRASIEALRQEKVREKGALTKRHILEFS